MSKKRKWHYATVKDIEIVSPSKMIFTANLDNDEIFNFQPGQFITMDLPLGDKRRQRWRSYSIANLPNEKNDLEFAIGHLEEGAASAYFFNTMKIGDEIKFKGPEGLFVLPENLDREIIMIATGTGVVPFVSMLRKIFKDNIDFKNIHLIYGSRFENDILYREELTEYAESNSNFKLDLVLSRQESWSGHNGYVHDIYKNNYQEKTNETLFLLCGWSTMIDEAMVNLYKIVDSPPAQIKYELYG